MAFFSNYSIRKKGLTGGNTYSEPMVIAKGATSTIRFHYSYADNWISAMQLSIEESDDGVNWEETFVSPYINQAKNNEPQDYLFRHKKHYFRYRIYATNGNTSFTYEANVLCDTDAIC